MIKFIWVELRGFASIVKPLRYRLNQPGLTLIKGENGVGKTTIFSGLTWALYGSTLKEKSTIAPWNDTRDESFNGTQVIVYFKKDGKSYKVYRHLAFKPEVHGSRGGDRLILTEGDKIRDDLRDKRDIQNEIINILGLSFELFKNSVVFGQKLKRLINEEGPTKKKLFEEAFETGYILKALEKAQAKKIELDKQYYPLNTKYVTIKTKMDGINDKIAYHESVQRAFEESKLGKIAELKAKIEPLRVNLTQAKEDLSKCEKAKAEMETLKGVIVELKKDIKDYDELSHTLFRLELKNEQDLGKIQELEGYIKTLKVDYVKVPKKCDKCSQPIRQDKIANIKASIKNQIHEYQLSIVKWNTKLGHDIPLMAKLRGDIKILEANSLELKAKESLSDNYRQIASGYGLAIKNINWIKSQIQDLKTRIETIRIEKLPNDLNTLRDELKTLGNELEPIETEKTALDKDIDLYDWLIKDPLSNNGLKMFIFNQLIKHLNAKLLGYQKYLGFNVKFFIDMKSFHKNFYVIISRNGIERKYEDLSGGQKQLVDVCIAFSVHDIVSIEKSMNILVLDEVFESLSSKNIELVGELINDRMREKSLHVITHLSDFQMAQARVVNLELDSNNSTVIA